MDIALKEKTAEEDVCPACGGYGEVEIEDCGVIGYATRDMAMDAQDMSLEGYPVYGAVRIRIPCPLCQKEDEPAESEPADKDVF